MMQANPLPEVEAPRDLYGSRAGGGKGTVMSQRRQDGSWRGRFRERLGFAARNVANARERATSSGREA